MFTDALLLDLFQGYGEVEKAYMGNYGQNEEHEAEDGEPPKFTGRFGFVIFKNIKNAQRVIRTSVVYQGVELMVRQARHRAHISKPKQTTH